MGQHLVQSAGLQRVHIAHGRHKRAGLVALRVAVVSTLVAFQSTQAASTAWVSTSSTAWLTDANWSPSGYAGSSATTSNVDIATFGATGTASPAGINFTTTGGVFYLGAIDNSALTRTVNNSSTTTAGLLRLNGATLGAYSNVILRNTAASTTLTLSNANGGMGVVLGGVTNNIVASDNSNIVIGGAITQVNTGSSLTFNGGAGSQLTLSGTNTFSGGLTINGGTVSMTSSLALGNSSNQTTILNGSILRFANTSAITAVSSRTYAIGGTGGGEIDATSTTAGVYTQLNGAISGTGGFKKGGAGILYLAGATNTFTGGTTISAGTLQIATAASLGNSANLTTIGSGTLYMYNDADFTTSFTPNLASSRNFSITDANSTLQVGGSQTWTINGVVDGVGKLNKTGTGTLVLTGDNVYTGGTNVTGGLLSITTTSALPAGQTTLNGGTFQYNYSLTPNATPASLVSTKTFSLGANGGTFDSPATAVRDLQLSGVVSGAGNLTKTGPNGLYLAATNTYTGATRITEGSLVISTDRNVGAVPASATPNKILLSGGTLSTTASFTLNPNRGIGIGPAAAPGTPTSVAGTLSVASGTSLTYGGVIADSLATDVTGSLRKAGAGTLILTGVNTYTGQTSIDAGVLLANTPTASGSSTGPGAVNINTGAQLAGTGQASGVVTVNSGGVVSAGSGAGTAAVASDSVGKLTTGNQVWKAGGTLRTKYASGSSAADAGTGYDTLSMGTLNLSDMVATGSKFNIAVLKMPSATFNTANDAAFKLASATSVTLDGTNAVAANTSLSDLFALDTSSLGVSNDESVIHFTVGTGSGGGDLMLFYDAEGQAAPEPTTAALVGLGGVAVLGRRRRREMAAVVK